MVAVWYYESGSSFGFWASILELDPYLFCSCLIYDLAEASIFVLIFCWVLLKRFFDEEVDLELLL
jgi:hypothetical protein